MDDLYWIVAILLLTGVAFLLLRLLGDDDERSAA